MIKVRGRTDDTFWVYDAARNPVALPPIPFEAVFLDVHGLMQYQLVQEERDLLRVFYRPKAGADVASVSAEIGTRLERYLEHKGLKGCMRIEITPVDQIVRHPTSGKIRQIYSKVERLYLPGRPLGERRAGDDRRLGGESPDLERRQQSRRQEDQEGGGDP
jgi:phenylacetate-coenzyme A ligase PaaK-like adenylate-forming protein